MKIKRLEIIGFKSFVDKAVLEFPEGVTAVVGPNGCGKSNVVDAIRWVMGEQSAKNLRGRLMEDVIFGGSESRKPLGMAEVSLIFSTEDGRIPAKYLNYSEIQVTRRLYRDGESEYYLNKTPCRLMDIAELFMDTGVGARAYSIIEQGRIGMILLAKPEERRFLIEEAAGVTKFKARKQVAVKKIEATRQNLIRIGDIVTEIRRQLNSLQRQAKKAERFRECREELKEIELTVIARRYASLAEEFRRHTAEAAAMESRAGELAATVNARELDLEAERLALVEEERKMTAAQEEIYRLKNEYQAGENRREYQKKELLNLERHSARFTEELTTLERQLAEGEAELKLLEVRRGEFLSEAVGEEQNLTARERALEELTAAERLLAGQLEEKRREQFVLLAEIARLGNQQQAAVKRLEAMAERLERHRREFLTLGEKLGEAQIRRRDLEASLTALVAQKGALVAELDGAREREVALKGQLAATEQQLQLDRDELNRKSSRLHSLQELEAQFAGYGRGVRTLLLAEEFKGRFHGVMADLIETGEEHETALEAVLGERLQYLVPGTGADPLAAIAFLKKHDGGRCSFLPGDPAPSRTPVHPAGTTPLLELVTVAPQYRPIIEPLLAGCCIVDDLSEGMALAHRHPDLVFVTPAGDLAHDGGIISGGSTEGGQQGLIHKKREIKELAARVQTLTITINERDEARTGLRQGLGAEEELLRQLRTRQHQTEMQHLNCDKDLQRAGEECLRLEDRLAVMGLEREQLEEERELLEREIAATGAGRDRTTEQEKLLGADLEDLNRTVTEQRRELESAREVVTTLKVRVAALSEKRESTLRACKRVTELVHDLAGRISGHRQELERGGQERERLLLAIAGSDGILRDLAQQERTADTLFAAVRSRFDSGAAALREADQQLKLLRTEAEAQRRHAADCGVKVAETALQLRHMEDSLGEKYRLDMAAILPRAADPEWDDTARRDRLQELQRLVEEMGEVNLTAIDEYREMEERFTFLTEQKGDLEESLNSLQQAIQRINRTTRKRFMETFQLVNVKFQEVFPRLFCGGRAELRLSAPEDLLETGIDIIVQPPGKKLQNVTLLSGGEKALTAVALIFAIFLIKPSPFCLLDEVDAPLDDANIGRFNEMIREMTAFSQFILITHSKTTMAVADTLYGVTMEEPGVSKLVSVRLH